MGDLDTSNRKVPTQVPIPNVEGDLRSRLAGYEDQDDGFLRGVGVPGSRRGAGR